MAYLHAIRARPRFAVAENRFEFPDRLRFILEALKDLTRVGYATYVITPLTLKVTKPIAHVGNPTEHASRGFYYCHELRKGHGEYRTIAIYHIEGT
jgi:hypothetical protein